MPSLASAPPPIPDPSRSAGGSPPDDEPRLTPDSQAAAGSSISGEATGEDSLRRYRGLQWISIAFITSGAGLIAGVLVLNRDLLAASTHDEVIRLLGPLLLAAGGALLLTVGLLMNAVRAVVVRAALRSTRYRGPAIFVLLGLALILANIISLAGAADALALTTGAPLSVSGTLVLVTAVQMAMLITVGALVIGPKALPGLSLAPRGRILRGILIGLGLAVPAWIGATLISALVSVVLKALGVTQSPGPVDQLIKRGDPVVLLVALVLVAPVAEELFFRGVVFNAWERERGPRVAVYGSATLFAAIHGVFLFVPILVLGMLLAQLYRRTRSLPATMALHAGFNAISLILALLVRLRIVDLPI